MHHIRLFSIDEGGGAERALWVPKALFATTESHLAEADSRRSSLVLVRRVNRSSRNVHGVSVLVSALADAPAPCSRRPTAEEKKGAGAAEQEAARGFLCLPAASCWMVKYSHFCKNLKPPVRDSRTDVDGVWAYIRFLKMCLHLSATHWWDAGKTGITNDVIHQL